MSNASTYIAVAVSWLGTIGAGVTGFIKQAKKYEGQINNVVATIEADVNAVLAEVQKVNVSLAALTPPAKPAAAKAPARKVTEAPVPRQRKAGR